MNFEYHQDTDMLYIKLSNGISVEFGRSFAWCGG